MSGDSESQSRLVSEPIEFDRDEEELDDDRSTDRVRPRTLADKSLNEIRRDFDEAAGRTRRRGFAIAKVASKVITAAVLAVAYAILYSASVIIALAAAVVLYYAAERAYARILNTYGSPPFLTDDPAEDAAEADDEPPVRVDVERMEDDDTESDDDD